MSDSLKSAPRHSLRIPFLEIFFCAFLAALTLLPLSPLFQRYPFRDSGVFLYTGWRIGEGEIPYVNVWDHKPPLIYFLDAAGLSLSGGSVWGVWAIEWISLFAVCGMGYFLGKKIFNSWASGVSLLLMLGVFSILVLGGNFTTEYALPLQIACLYLAIGLQEEKSGTLRMVLIGILCSGLFLLKPNLIGIPIVVSVFRFIFLCRKRQWKTGIAEIAAFAAGNILILLPVVGYFAAHNALSAFWDSAFRYNLYYSETGIASVGKSIVHGQEAVSRTGFGILGIIGWALGLWFILKREALFRKNGLWLAMVWCALPVELLFAALPGRFEEHYYLSVLPLFFYLCRVRVLVDLSSE